MKLVIFLAVALVVLMVCQEIYARPGIEEELKNVERAGQRVRDAAERLLPTLQGYAALAQQFGLTPDKKD